MKSCWAQYLLWLVIAVLGTGSALSACGQKGALVQPDSPAVTPVKSEPSASSVKKEPPAPPIQKEPAP